MDEIKDIVKGVLSDLKKKEKEADFERVLEHWKEIVGPRAYAHTKIVHLTKEKIHVNVDNSAHLFDLNLKKERIQLELKKCLGVEQVRLKLGPI